MSKWVGPALLAPGLLAAASALSGQGGFAVEELWRTTGEDLPGGPLGAVTGIVSVADGPIWVSDPVTRRVVAFGPDGRGLGIVARSGDGPGEVRSPTRLASSGDTVAVYDVGRSSIELFSASSGAFIERIRLGAQVTWPKGFVVVPGHGFVLTGGVPGSGHAVHQFDHTGAHVASWEPLPRTREPYAALVVAGGPLTLLPDGRLLLSHATPHLLKSYRIGPGQRYGADGSVLARDRDLLQPVLDDAIEVTNRDGVRVQRFRQYPRSAGVFALRSGGILNVVVFPDQDRTFLQLYDPSGSLVADQLLPGVMILQALTDTDDLLVGFLDPETSEWIVARLRLFADPG